MKSIGLTLALLILAIYSSLLSAKSPLGTEDLLGEVTAVELLNVEAFAREYEAARISDADIEALKGLQDAVTLHVLFGTWCHDSMREVPRIIKLVERANNANISLLLTAISNDKLRPETSVTLYALKFTPTLVILKGELEIGRIIETPELTWATDIVSLVQAH